MESLQVVWHVLAVIQFLRPSSAMITYCFADIRLHVDDAEGRGSADISKEKLEPLLTKTDFAVLLQIMNGKRNYMPYAPTYSTLQML